MENNKLHILVVDDDDRIRNLLKDYLSDNNYIVSTAENAERAKEKINYIKFDIIILAFIKSLSTLFRLCFVTFSLNMSSPRLIPGFLSIKFKALKCAGPKNFFDSISRGSENVSL